MYQYDWGKTKKKINLSFGHCPDNPSPTSARDLGTFFIFWSCQNKKRSKSIWTGYSPLHADLGNCLKKVSILIWGGGSPNLGDSQKKEYFTLVSPPWVPCKRNCRALNLKIRKEQPEGKDVSRFVFRFSFMQSGVFEAKSFPLVEKHHRCIRKAISHGGLLIE